MAIELLDDNSVLKRKSLILTRYGWYVKHSAMVIGWHLVGLIFLLWVFPILPSSVADYSTRPSLSLFVFAIYSITTYCFYKGLGWNPVLAFVGSFLGFLLCFAITMNNLESLTIDYSIGLKNLLKLTPENGKKVLEVLTMGVVYNFLILAFAEFFSLLGLFLKPLSLKILKSE